MDAIDHLFAQLVDALRRERPGGLRDRYTVRTLYEDLIPYRRVRDAAGFRSNADYEVTLCRLLAGEGGLVASASDEMAAALREALAEPVPDTRRYRSFAEVEVWIDAPVIPPSGSARYAPPELRPSEEELAAGLPGDAVEPPGLWSDAEAPARADTRVPDPGLRTPESEEEPAADERAVVDGQPASDDREALEGPARCPACGSELPGRPLHFCPHCGVAVGEGACDGCGAALEPAWRFCPECGRERGGGRGYSA